jgi:hypothetical protein
MKNSAALIYGLMFLGVIAVLLNWKRIFGPSLSDYLIGQQSGYDVYTGQTNQEMGQQILDSEPSPDWQLGTIPLATMDDLPEVPVGG